MVIIRIAEYGSAISIENAELTKNGLILRFPDSGIIFLHTGEQIPSNFTITIKVPQGGEVSYKVPAIQIRDYSIEDLFEKKLLILLPFYLFRYDGDFEEMDQEEEATSETEC